jgi:SH3-like domain-containing protein
VRAAGPTSARPPGDAAASAGAKPADVGSVTGLPLPRFAALRSNEVDLRAGPGFRYPIRWVYRRLGMPVEIEREFGVWREVLMPDGTRGWMHEATLNGRHDGIVMGGRHTMRQAAAATAGAVAIVEPGVILRILRCDAGAVWCRVAAASFRGWLPRADFWGTFPGEKVVGH